MEETWKDIPGYEELYQASSEGRIRSKRRARYRIRNGVTERFGMTKERVLKEAFNKNGYGHVVLRRNGKSESKEVHLLIALAFLGPRPNGDAQIRHLDGNPRNNRVENLRYGTRSENQIDLYDYRGYHHRLSAKDVHDIRARLARGETGRSIAKLYSTTESNISSIKHGGTYKWLV